MNKLIEFAFILAVAAGIVLGVYWLLWLLWCWALPQLWPSGPETLLQPGYWLFSGSWLLIALLGRAVFGSRE